MGDGVKLVQQLVAFLSQLVLQVFLLVPPLALLHVKTDGIDGLVAFAHPAQLVLQFFDLLLLLLDQLRHCLLEVLLILLVLTDPPQ